MKEVILQLGLGGWASSVGVSTLASHCGHLGILIWLIWVGPGHWWVSFPGNSNV